MLLLSLIDLTLARAGSPLRQMALPVGHGEGPEAGPVHPHPCSSPATKAQPCKPNTLTFYTCCFWDFRWSHIESWLKLHVQIVFFQLSPLWEPFSFSKGYVSSFLSSMIYKLEKGKHHLMIKHCLKYFCNLSSWTKKVLKDCIALFGVGANRVFCRCVFWQENNLNVKV